MINTAHNTRRLIIGIFSITEMFEMSAQWADAACAVRVKERVKDVADFLISSDSPAHAPIGKYYAGMAVVSDDPTAAQGLFYQGLETPFKKYRDRASLGIVATLIYAQDYSTAIKLCEQLKDTQDEYTYLERARAMGMACGLAGDVDREIEILESVYPAVKRCSERLAHLRYHHANNRAAALKEVSRLDEAEKWAELACSNPIISSRFPENVQTRDGIVRAKAERKRAWLPGFRPFAVKSPTELLALDIKDSICRYVEGYPSVVVALQAMNQAVVTVGEGLIKKPINDI